MNNVSWLKLYGITLVILAVIDIPWILLVANGFYLEQIGHLMADKPLYWPAVLFYSMYAFALLYFVIAPCFEASLLEVFLRGCFFGFVVYSAYDLTNQATLRNWPLVMTIVDMAWGSFLSGLASALTVFVIRCF